MKTRVRLAAVWLVAGTLGACASSTPPKPPHTVEPQKQPRPLTDLVPAAGLRWLVVARPKELYAEAELAASLVRLFPKERLDAFARASGIDLRALDSGVIAGFDLGTLYLAEAPGRIDAAQRAFLERLVSLPVTKQLGKGVTHTTGIIGLTPESFLTIDGLGIGVSVGDPTLTKIAGAFALGKLEKSPPALSGAALSELPQSLESYPLRFYAPGPFEGEWTRGARGLLAETLAVAIVARPEPEGVFRVALTAMGDYGSDLAVTNQKARQSYQDLAQSDLGRLLGLGSDQVAPEVIVEARRITIHVQLPLKRLMDGLYTAVAADVWEMLDVAKPVPARAPSKI
jgi:hypothetical protein